MKTKASKPAADKNSSAGNRNALTIQPGEGTSLSKLKGPLRLSRSSATMRGAYTYTLPGCFLSSEYNDRSRTQSAMFMPAEVKSADTIIFASIRF